LVASSNQTAPHSQRTAPDPTYCASVADGQWHHFGAQVASTTRAASPQAAASESRTSEPSRAHNVSLAEAR
jgi:hypothetical protein